MNKHLEKGYLELIEALAHTPGVIAVGKSGGAPLLLDSESDIDLFVFCDEIPSQDTRRGVLSAAGGGDMHLAERAGAFWGICDFVSIADAEVCLMYFTTADMDAQIASVLAGERLDREGEYFYPTGRCATILSMHILRDRTGYIAATQQKLSVYPEALAEKLASHHLRKIDNAEDFMRAVSRAEVLFFHATLEAAMDHFLQALFALNRCFFPSRKRTLSFVEGFGLKPSDCAKRLLEVVELGAKPGTLSQSYTLWQALCSDLRSISDGAV